MENNFGLIRVVAACPQVSIANVTKNVQTIAEACKEIEKECHPSVITFPELCISGYTCEELFNQSTLYQMVEEGMKELLELTKDCEALIVVGLPLIVRTRRYNSAALIRKGKILGLVPKIYLPNNEEFYEARYFESGALLGSDILQIEYASQMCPFGILQLFDLGKACISVEICQDLWVPIPPSSYATLSGANLVLNLSASNELAGKQEYRKTLLSATSSRLSTAYVYSSIGYGESSDDLVWAGSSLIYEKGECLAENKRFDKNANWIAADIDLDALEQSRAHNVNFTHIGAIWADAWPYSPGGNTYLHIDCGACVPTDFKEKLYRPLERHPFFLGGTEQILSQCRETFDIQVTGLQTRLEHIACKKAVIGVSGGLDSTLALLVVCEAFDRIGLDRKNIIAVTMPCFGTSERTFNNANSLMQELGVSLRVIDIQKVCLQHMNDIGIDPNNYNIAYENAQARERTQILMDIANSVGGIVIGTGDLSELALGWCTYNGDHMSNYGVNVSVPKTLVREITRWKAESLACKDTLIDILETPVSPELVPGAQMTEDLVGPYDLHDFFLWHFFEGSTPSKIYLLACHAFAVKNPSYDACASKNTHSEYSSATILKWLKVFYKRFFTSQFKRSCLPNGPKTGKISLSPRGDWRMATDASIAIWQKELDELE